MKITVENVVPKKNMLLLEPYKQADETEGGLVISQGDGFASPIMGTVLRVGSKATYKVGTVVMFRKYSVDALKLNTSEGQKEFYLLEDEEVIATVGE